MAELNVITQKGTTCLPSAIDVDAGVRQAHLSGVLIGLGQFFIFGCYAIGMWYGGMLVANGEMDPGDLLTVFFTVVIIGVSVGAALELLPELMKARIASAEIFYGARVSNPSGDNSKCSD